MAKPRTFVSSTCLDLRDARSVVEKHLIELGHEPLLSDTLTFGVTPKKHSHHACLDQVDNADYFILIVGGRRGGTYIGSERSITNEEYRRAMKRGIPVMTFVSEGLETASRIYRKTPKADLSEFVDDVRVFDFIDLIRGESEDNWIRTYKTVEDIKRAITAQLAYICLVYSQQMRKGFEDMPDEAPVARPFPRELGLPKDLAAAELTALKSGLKTLHRILAKLLSADVKGKDEKIKVLWLLGRYGSDGGWDVSRLTMSFDQFKQYAFAKSRAQRVFTQLRDFEVLASIDDPEDGDGLRVELSFEDDNAGEVVAALKYYVRALLYRHQDDDALALFKRADMSVPT
jgi:hypothetical protein